MTVEDDGPGVSPEHIDRIFEPFFTTLALEGAAGLGLATCSTIARRHGGNLWVESRPGGGARFHLDLPAASAPQGEALPTEEKGAALTAPKYFFVASCGSGKDPDGHTDGCPRSDR